MNTRQYYHLTAIAEYGNLSNAARALSISQPALSKFLNEVEDALGEPLFHRVRRHYTPTETGRLVLDAAQRILDEQNRMIRTMRSAVGREHQVIRLATAPNRSAIIISKIYNQFSRRYPDITLKPSELYAHEQPEAIARGRVDLALGAGPMSDRVVDLPVAHEELLISLPASHPLAGQPSLRLPDLKDTPFVLQGHRHSIRGIAEKLFRKADFHPFVAFESDNVYLLDSMMHQAVGAGLVSRVHVMPCEELVYKPLDPPVYQILHIRYPLGHTLTPPERYLASLLIKERLSDPRYEAVYSLEVEELLRSADTEQILKSKDPSPAVGTSLQQIREISFDTRILEYLIAIVEEHSLSKAAEKYYLAQPALSRHLRNVERMLGMPLFEREHNRLSPTDAGKVFLNSSRNILHIENDMLKRLRQAKQIKTEKA